MTGIDSQPDPDAARKLEFARDAGAVPIWIRHGKGGITEPGGVAVIEAREPVAAAARAAQAARDQEPGRRIERLRAKRSCSSRIPGR